MTFKSKSFFKTNILALTMTKKLHQHSPWAPARPSLNLKMLSRLNQNKSFHGTYTKRNFIKSIINSKHIEKKSTCAFKSSVRWCDSYSKPFLLQILVNILTLIILGFLLMYKSKTGFSNRFLNKKNYISKCDLKWKIFCSRSNNWARI